MTLTVKIILCTALALGVIIPFTYFMKSDRSKSNYKKALFSNIFAFFGIIVLMGIIMFVGEPAKAATQSAGSISNGLGYLAAALSTGMSCLGGGIAVASAASAALGAISEDPSALGKSLIFVGLAEGVCLYGLIISFMIIGQLG